MSTFFRKIISNIGRPRCILFCIILFVGYLFYYTQPYLLAKLFVGTKDKSMNFVVFILLGASLMVIPILNILNNRFIQDIRKMTKYELWHSIANKPYSYFQTVTIGEAQSYVNEVSFASRSLEQTSLLVLIRLLAMLGLYTVLLSLSSVLVGGTYFVIFTIYLFVSAWFARKNRQHVANSLKRTSAVNDYMHDYYQNIETIISVQSARYELDRMDSVLENERKTYYRVQRNSNNGALFQQALIVTLAGIVSVFGVIVLGVKSENAFSAILILLYSVLNLSGFGIEYLSFEELLNRVRAGLRELGYSESEGGEGLKFNFHEEAKALDVNHLYYTYPNGDAIFSNLIVSFEKNKRTALVGQNGSGKSTLLKIIDGFYKSSKGEIVLPYHCPKVLYLPQNAPLFNRSVWENIVYPNKKISVEDLMSLVGEIQLTSLIKSPEDLFNKKVGDFKNLISGGEQQKILFLRAVVTRPDVLLIDELTSDLDESTIIILYNMLDKYLRKTTVISVVHRETELKYYDAIVSI